MPARPYPDTVGGMRGYPLAVVMGDLELVQALGRAGIRSVVVGPPDSRIRHSRYVVDAIDAPRWRHLDPGDDTLIERLLDLAARQDKPPVVYYDSDEALDFLARNCATLEGPLRLHMPSSELIRQMTDKALFQALGEQLDLPVPPAQWLVPSVTDPPPGLPFPLMLKPVPRRDASWRDLAGDAKALRVADRDELDALWPRLAADEIAVLGQEEVPGPETEILSYHVYVDRDGEIAGDFTGRKIRTFPLEHGMSTALITTADERVARLGRDYTRRIGLRGPAKLDFKRAPDGELKLLEVNPRFTLWVHAGAVAGVNLPALMHAELSGLPRPARSAGRAGVRWVSLPTDRDAAVATGMTRARWYAWALRCETNSSFSWGDPGPLIARFAGGRRRARV
jgi:D-aspartate ligase